jgi:hypothetical protein
MPTRGNVPYGTSENFSSAFPTLMRGANKLCASGADLPALYDRAGCINSVLKGHDFSRAVKA